MVARWLPGRLIGGTPFDTALVGFTVSGDRFFYTPGRPYSQVNLVAWDGTGSGVIFGVGEGKRKLGSVALSADGWNVALQLRGYFRRPVQPTQIALTASDGSGQII